MEATIVIGLNGHICTDCSIFLDFFGVASCSLGNPAPEVDGVLSSLPLQKYTVMDHITCLCLPYPGSLLFSKAPLFLLALRFSQWEFHLVSLCQVSAFLSW